MTRVGSIDFIPELVEEEVSWLTINVVDWPAVTEEVKPFGGGDDVACAVGVARGELIVEDTLANEGANEAGLLDAVEPGASVGRRD